MTTDLERVARAIEPDTFNLPRINLYAPAYEAAYRKARAAIEAIRVPSPTMLSASVIKAHMGDGPPHFIGSETRVVRADPDMWTAMCDVILKGEG